VKRRRRDPNCPGCAALRSVVAARDAALAARDELIKSLQTELAKTRKDSSTSSKPPSSDIVKPKKEKPTKKGKKRKRGGQPGHPKHDRPAFRPEEVTTFHEYHIENCPDCGQKLEPSDAVPRILQQIEIHETPVHIDEHRGYAYWCSRCQKIHYAPIPPEIVRAGLSGPRLRALVVYMKGACHASFSTIRKFLRDVVGARVCRGYLRKLVNEASEAVDVAYQQLLDSLPSEPRLNVDETGHKENGEKFWTWCFRAELYTLFKIHKSRGSKVLIEVLGKEFDGVLGCDYFSAYRKYMRECNIIVQFCLAHLIRDVKFLVKLPDKDTSDYGRRLLDGLRELFKVIHRRESMTEEKFQAELEEIRDRLIETAMAAPERSEAQNMANRFRKHGKAYFEFITTPGVEPTNNLAEQAIRFVVIDRRVTQGTRSEAGREWCERIWTLIATCVQQGRSVFEFLYESIAAYFAGRPGPTLLPQSVNTS